MYKTIFKKYSNICNSFLIGLYHFIIYNNWEINKNRNN